MLGLLAKTEAISSDVGSAVPHVIAAASLLDGMLDGELEQRPEAALLVGWSEFLLDRPRSALRHLDRGLALAHRGGRAFTGAPLLIGRVLALRATGQLAEASAAAEEAVELASLSGHDEHRTAALALRSWVATWTGDLEVARAAAAVAGRAVAPAFARLARVPRRQDPVRCPAGHGRSRGMPGPGHLRRRH